MNLTIAKNRKTGEWKVLASPDETYDKHMAAHRKLSDSFPVNDEWSEVSTGRLSPTLPGKKFITSTEAETQRITQTEQVNRVQDAVEAAQRRQAANDAAAQKVRDDNHAKALAAKNAIVASVQSETANQPKPAVITTKK